jgi:hypothetical protein
VEPVLVMTEMVRVFGEVAVAVQMRMVHVVSGESRRCDRNHC